MYKFFTLATALAVLCSCDSPDTQHTQDDPATATDACPQQGTGNTAFMSFSGGGYHAHAGAASVMMSLMDRVRENVDGNKSDKIGMCDITKNVGAMSSNSGGSWFLTQAAYTDKFRNALEAPDAWQTFTSTDGYFGQAYGYISKLKADDKVCDIIKDLPFETPEEREEEYEKCINTVQTADSFLKFLLSGGDANWHELARNAVFGDRFEDKSWAVLAESASNSVLTSPTRQDWSEGKSLVFASSLLSNSPALNLGIADINSLQATQGGSDSPVPGAAPVMFSVPPVDSASNKSSTFLLGGDTKLTYGRVGLGGESFEADGQLNPVMVPANISVESSTILSAAASSSAAGGGFIDVPSMTASDLPPALALALNNFAPAFTLKNEEVTYVGPLHKDPVPVPYSLSELHEKQAVRFADGGFVDNTAVAYMVSHLADTSQLNDGFTILAMDNYPGQRVPDDLGGWLPSAMDVASLFGYPNKDDTTRTSQLFGLFSFTGIVPHVFESNAYFTKEKGVKPADWCAWIEPAGVKSDTCVSIPVAPVEGDNDDAPCDLFLSYTHYEVTVRENAYFGITSDNGAGTKGNLHVFSNMGANTGVVPDSDFQARCYTKMMQGVHEAVTDKDYMFGTKLATLLGLE